MYKFALDPGSSSCSMNVVVSDAIHVQSRHHVPNVGWNYAIFVAMYV